MKVLFLLLVLLNLGALAWQFMGDPTTTTAADGGDTGKTLVLLRELNAEQLTQLTPVVTEELPLQPAEAP